MIRRTALALAATAAASIFVTLGPMALAEDQFIIIQSTTSTQNSGLFDHILPIFQERTGIEAAPLGSQAVGTCGAKPTRVFSDGEEAADVVVTLRARGHSTAWICRRLGVDRETVKAIAQQRHPTDAALLGKLRQMLTVPWMKT
jgi:tungstate transport system substrate-binding protein